ncbi:hypothetical protein ACIGO8_07300 [Streptomyces sp. NPDC053493]|uniref:hypothetical protein n=1 Tax=Streptomyces sp. NPDC053493 TaxID=3365705 RepID=UPI0037D81AE1
MTDISFTPTFKHVTWVDNRDRVAAGGQNGFNVRFDAIQKDLAELSRVVGVIDAGLKAAGQHPATTRLLALAPAFTPLPPAKPWGLDRFGVATRLSTTDSSVTGLIPVSPPDGAKLLKLRAVGQNSGGGNLAVSLFRAKLADATARESIASVTCTGTFDAPVDVTPGKEVVDMATYRYFVTASLSNAADGDIVNIISVQLSYIAA